MKRFFAMLFAATFFFCLTVPAVAAPRAALCMEGDGGEMIFVSQSEWQAVQDSWEFRVDGYARHQEVCTRKFVCSKNDDHTEYVNVYRYTDWYFWGY